MMPTGSVRQARERIPPRAEELERKRERKRVAIKSMNSRVDRMARLDPLITTGPLEAGALAAVNVVTGNGTALRRCSPDGRTNVRVLLFQLCGLPVLPLRLLHHDCLLAPSYCSVTCLVRTVVRV